MAATWDNLEGDIDLWSGTCWDTLHTDEMADSLASREHAKIVRIGRAEIM